MSDHWLLKKKREGCFILFSMNSMFMLIQFLCGEKCERLQTMQHRIHLYFKEDDQTFIVKCAFFL